MGYYYSKATPQNIIIIIIISVKVAPSGDDSFDVAYVASAVDFEGYTAEVDALMSVDDNPHFPELLTSAH